EIEDIVKDPVFLKLDLMIKGIKLPVFLQKRLNGESDFSAIEGIEIELRKGIKVKAPYNDRIAINSPYTLDSDMRAILAGGYSIPIRVMEPIRLTGKKTSSGMAMSSIAHLYDKYLAITPSLACGYFGERLGCIFCPSYGTARDGADVAGTDDVLETIRTVYRIQKPSAILLSIGAMKAEDAGMGFAEKYLRAIHKHFNVMTILEISPPRDTGWIETAYGAGADAICFNIDIFDEKLFAELCPGKAEDNGRHLYMRALSHASGFFPMGTVMTHLIVGIEPLESTIEGIEYLASNGIVPILSVFRPVNTSMMKYYTPLSVEELLPVYKAVHCSLRRHSIPAVWTKYMGFAITPAEARLFACRSRIKRRLNVMVENSGLIDTAKAGMLRMRRSLRVREV
ncbi:MAG: hypothetical protein M1491_01790, partial [Deltaproteobacteria bacterium]|nr:hypothetical protein [Deltaproteobacteria bacterium]